MFFNKRNPEEFLFLRKFHFYRTGRECEVYCEAAKQVVISFVMNKSFLSFSVDDSNLIIAYDMHKTVIDCEKLTVKEETGGKLISKLCFISAGENYAEILFNDRMVHTKKVFHLKDYIIAGNTVLGVYEKKTGTKVDDISFDPKAEISFHESDENSINIILGKQSVTYDASSQKTVDGEHSLIISYFEQTIDE